MNRIGLVVLSILSAGSGGSWVARAAQQPEAVQADQQALREAAGWIQEAGRTGLAAEAEYNYEMTCKVRLLLLWVGRDDVGEGYIRVGKASGPFDGQLFQALFGSDPAKAPRAINRWGAGTEVFRGEGRDNPHASSVFFGFMKSSKGHSPGAMQQELSRENNGGGHAFEGIISRVDEKRAIAATVPFTSAKDFDIHQYSEAETAALGELEAGQDRKIKQLKRDSQVGCNRTGGFLSTIQELIDEAVDGSPSQASLCYVYNARLYSATLLSAHAVPDRTIRYTPRGGPDADYTAHNLREARFIVTNHESGGKSTFQVLLGTKGGLRGVPIQILYAPNWWFQIILNLTPSSLQTLDQASASRPTPSL